MGCPCHINHNAAHQGSMAFTSANTLRLLCGLVLLFQLEYQEKVCFKNIFDQEYKQILKPINLQWLSLERAAERILKQYAGLQSYFLSEDAPATGGKSEWGERKWFLRLKIIFKDPMTEIFLFFSSVLPTFTNTSILL